VPWPKYNVFRCLSIHTLLCDPKCV
jgi:hypothetical protein